MLKTPEVLRACAAAIVFVSLAAARAATSPVTSGVSHTPLVDQDGRTFSLASLHGSPLIVTFVAAHCTDACPLVNAQFEQAAQVLGERHVRARLLTITLDPEHDSIRDMQHVARAFSARASTWIVAAGTSAHVHAIMRAFGVIALRGKYGFADEHSTYVYLLDRDGRLRRTVLASSDLANQILTEAEAAWHDSTF